MDLKKQLLKEHSKANCNTIVQWIGSNQPRFDELVGIFLSSEYRLVQLSAWPISYAAIAHPALVKKHFSKLINNLDKPGIPIAVKRNTLRLLQEIAIPKKFHGKLMDACFRYIASPTEAIAVKAFSMRVLENLCTVYPEIIPEIQLVIDENYDRETPAFKARARMFLKKYPK